MNSPKFNQSIDPVKCLFYEDVKQFAKVYFINAVAVRICQFFFVAKVSSFTVAGDSQKN